jgi:membrane protein DedA with SNARE-associated domain
MQNWIVDIIRSLGAPGIALLMLLENVFPPLPSEFIMPLAGYLSIRSEPFGFWTAVAAGTVGSGAGAFLWYGLGRTVSEARLCGWIETHGVWLAMRPSDLDKARAFFERHGSASVFVGRLVPVVRTLVSVPAGFSQMPAAPFLMYTTLGTFIWTAALAWSGRLLGRQFPQVGAYLGVVAWFVVGAAVLLYVVRVWQLRHARRRPPRR